MGTVKQEECLERIADALEKTDSSLGRIADALESIDNRLDMLTDCVGYIPPNYYQKEGCHIFRIGGSVDVD